MGEDLEKFVERYPTYLEALDEIDKLKKRITELEEDYEKLRKSSCAIYCALADILGKENPEHVPSRIDQLTGQYLAEYADMWQGYKLKNSRIEKLEEEVKQLKAEPEKVWNDNLQEIKNDIVDKFIEQIHKEYRKEFDRRLEEKTRSIKDDFENQRKLLTESYNNKISELQGQCDKHLKSRVELIKQTVELQQENAKLQEQLKNAIVPKFKYGQTVYIIDKQFNCIFDEVYIGENKDRIILSSCIIVNHYREIEKELVFSTEDEAQKYLEEKK